MDQPQPVLRRPEYLCSEGLHLMILLCFQGMLAMLAWKKANKEKQDSMVYICKPIKWNSEVLAAIHRASFTQHLGMKGQVMIG